MTSADAGADDAEAVDAALSCAGGGGGGESSSASCAACKPAVTIAGGASDDDMMRARASRVEHTENLHSTAQSERWEQWSESRCRIEAQEEHRRMSTRVCTPRLSRSLRRNALRTAISIVLMRAALLIACASQCLTYSYGTGVVCSFTRADQKAGPIDRRAEASAAIAVGIDGSEWHAQRARCSRNQSRSAHCSPPRGHAHRGCGCLNDRWPICIIESTVRSSQPEWTAQQLAQTRERQRRSDTAVGSVLGPPPRLQVRRICPPDSHRTSHVLCADPSRRALCYEFR